MLAASTWFKRVSQFKSRSYLSNIEPTVCSNCQINRLIRREPANGKRKWWFDKDVNGYLLKSSNGLQRRRLSQRTNFITSILVVSWMWPYYANTSIGIYQSIATQASPLEEELTDEFLNRLLSAVENDPTSTRETCTAYIEKLCRARKLSVAARLLQSLRDKRIFLTTNAYNLLLVTAGEGNDIGLVCQIFKDLLVSWEPIGCSYKRCLFSVWKSAAVEKIF